MALSNAERQARWREKVRRRLANASDSSLDAADLEAEKKASYVQGAEYGYRQGYRQGFMKAASSSPRNDGCKLDQRTRTRLVKLLGMLGGNQEGERATAAAMASELLRNMKLGWDDVIG